MHNSLHWDHSLWPSMDNTANTHNFTKQAEAPVVEFNGLENSMKRTLSDAHAGGIKEIERL